MLALSKLPWGGPLSSGESKGYNGLPRRRLFIKHGLDSAYLNVCIYRFWPVRTSLSDLSGQAGVRVPRPRGGAAHDAVGAALAATHLALQMPRGRRSPRCGLPLPADSMLVASSPPFASVQDLTISLILGDCFLKLYPPFRRYGAFSGQFSETIDIQRVACAFYSRKTAWRRVLSIGRADKVGARLTGGGGAG